MKRVIPSMISAIAIFAATTAFAADVTGAIKSVDTKKHEVVLDNGQTYIFPAKVDLSKMKAGETVKIKLETKKGKHEASAIAAAS